MRKNRSNNYIVFFNISINEIMDEHVITRIFITGPSQISAQKRISLILFSNVFLGKFALILLKELGSMNFLSPFSHKNI